MESFEERVLLAVGPCIASATNAPVNLRMDTLDSVDVTFNVAIDFGGSFTVEDVSIASPSAAITPTGITPLGGNSYRTDFASQLARGIYRVQVGPAMVGFFEA